MPLHFPCFFYQLSLLRSRNLLVPRLSLLLVPRPIWGEIFDLQNLGMGEDRHFWNGKNMNENWKEEKDRVSWADRDVVWLRDEAGPASWQSSKAWTVQVRSLCFARWRQWGATRSLLENVEVEEGLLRKGKQMGGGQGRPREGADWGGRRQLQSEAWWHILGLGGGRGKGEASLWYFRCSYLGKVQSPMKCQVLVDGPHLIPGCERVPSSVAEPFDRGVPEGGWESPSFSGASLRCY